MHKDLPPLDSRPPPPPVKPPKTQSQKMSDLARSVLLMKPSQKDAQLVESATKVKAPNSWPDPPYTKPTYVLDTNVLIHDPEALNKFDSIYLPMTVLEELDANKKGNSEVARNARQASRNIEGNSKINLSATASDLKGNNSILDSILKLDCGNIVLVSKDINMRVKARALGITAEDYNSESITEDSLYTGVEDSDVPNTFFRKLRNIRKGQKCNVTYQKPWGLKAQNIEQFYALELLMDKNVDFVSILGQAGTGKTILTLAAALQQVIEDKTYSEIIITRSTTPLGEDIGFLPGTEVEKMTPWMGCLTDNLEVLLGTASENQFTEKFIKIKALAFMRGRTFLNKFIIIDEAQNLSPKQIKSLVSRAGPDSKVVCLGNLSQIDTPYLTPESCGLAYAVEKFKKWEHSGHITLAKCERSRLAEFVNEEL